MAKTKKTVKKTAKKTVKNTVKKLSKPVKIKKAVALKKAVKKAGTTKKTEAKPERLKLSAKEKRDYKDMLLSMRQRLSGQVTALTRESLQRSDSVVSVEDGTDAFDRQFALQIASSEQDSLFEVDDALRRLGEGRYGVCEDCGCNIKIPRLKALPFVRLCIKCQSLTEKGRARFRP